MTPYCSPRTLTGDGNAATLLTLAAARAAADALAGWSSSGSDGLFN